MADGWYTHGPVAVYDARQGMADRILQNGTGGKAVLSKDGAALPIRDLNGTPLASDAITSNADGQSAMFLVQSRYCLVQFGDIVNPSWGVEVADELENQSQVLASAQQAVAAAQQAVQQAQEAVAAAQQGGGTGGTTATWATLSDKPTTFPPTSHTHPAGQISDATSVGRGVVTASTAADARAAIGAGTGNGSSNLAIGSSATTAAAGNHGHAASAVTFTPAGGVTASDVQAAIVQAAGMGGSGSGGGGGNTLSVPYSTAFAATSRTQITTSSSVSIRVFGAAAGAALPSWINEVLGDFMEDTSGVDAMAAPTGTAAARQVPYRDDANALRWTAATAVVARALGWVVVDDFAGVDPTGATSSKAAIDAAHTACPVNGTLYFGAGTYAWTGDVVLTRLGISVTGPAAILTGQLRFGPGTARNATSPARADLKGALHNITCSRPLNKTTYPVKGYADGSYFVALDCVRDMDISFVTFFGAAYPVYKVPNPAAASHDNSMIRVHHNRFDECDIAFYAPNDAAETWQSLADSDFTDNVVNRSYVGMFHAAGMDGGHIAGNTHFMINYNSSTNARFQEKRQNIWVGQCDWMDVEGNQLFESGLEAIFLGRARIAKVRANTLSWPGQVTPSDAIVIESGSGGAYAAGEYATAIVSGNVSHYYSKSFLRLVGDFTPISLGPNIVRYSGTGSSVRYRGTTESTDAQREASLAALPHYRYDLGDVTGITATAIDILDAPILKSNHYDALPGHPYATKIDPLAGWSAQSSAFRGPVTIVASTGFILLALKDIYDSTTTYGGLFVITVKSGTSNSAAKESQYLVHMGKRAAGTVYLAVLSAQGYTAGALADDPSFTFDVSPSQNALRATPVGSTAGSFYFSVTSIGNVVVG